MKQTRSDPITTANVSFYYTYMVSIPAMVESHVAQNGPTNPHADLERCRALCLSVYKKRRAHTDSVAVHDTIDGHRRRFYCDGGSTDTQVVCQESLNHGIEIVVRGTGSRWSVVTDMKCWQSKMPTCNRADFGSVHHGFLAAALDVVRPIRSWLAAAPRTGRVVITGHSLGAGIATLLAPMIDDLATMTVVVTFGSPRVGNMAFMQAYAACDDIRHIRVTNDDDPISYVPIIGYHHVGHALVLPRPPPDAVTPIEVTNNINDSVWYVLWVHWALRQALQITHYIPSLAAHSLMEYKTRLKKFSRIQAQAESQSHDEDEYDADEEGSNNKDKVKASDRHKYKHSAKASHSGHSGGHAAPAAARCGDGVDVDCVDDACAM